MNSDFSKSEFIFFGTPEFAATILQKLIEGGFVPMALVCNPDKPVGRKKIVTPPPVKRLAANGKWQMEILQPEDLKAISHELKAMKPDFAVVAAYAKIIPKEILDLFPRGVIGVHPSLLPKYRGASPIQSTLLAGEEETGVTLYLLDEKMDHGPMIANAKFKMQNEKLTYAELMQKLAELGGDLLVKTLPDFLAKKITPQPQDESLATYTKKFTAEDAFVDWTDIEKARREGGEIADTIEREIRALNPEPGVWTISTDLAEDKLSNGKKRRLKLLEAGIENGRLKIKKIQFEGEKPRKI